MTDEGSHHDRSAEPAGSAVLALLLGGLALCMGCSREDAPSPKPGDTALPSSPAASTPAKKASAKPPVPPVPEIPSSCGLDLGSPLPTGTSASGWVRKSDDGRRMVKLSEPKASLRFALARTPGEYVLTGVARVDGANTATLTPTLNAKALQPWPLSRNWNMYSSPVPNDALVATKTQLDFEAEGPKEPAEVQLDAVALVPLSDRVSVQMGAEATGLLIDGFYEVEQGGLRWSKGKKSVWGAVLKPGSGSHRLVIRGSAFQPLSPVAVKASVNGKDVGSASFDDKFRSVRWNIPAGVLTSGLNRVDLIYDKAGKPSEHSESKDTREIAVRFARLEVLPER